MLCMTQEQHSLEDRWASYTRLDRIRDHWYWRPGWRIGRSFYTWHLTFADAENLHRLADTVRTALDLTILSPVPDDGLHLTMQGVGFADEVNDRDLSAVIDAAKHQVRHLESFNLSLGPVDPDAEGIGLLVQPWAPVIALRHTLRAAIVDVWGPSNVPEQADGFRPHVTIAYSASNADTADLRTRLTPLRELEPATVKIANAQLIQLNRDEKIYQWKTIATLDL